MSDVIVITERQIAEDSTPTVSARDLHKWLGVGRDFSSWIKDRIALYSFMENKDFVVFTGTGENAGRPSREYAITLDMAKELAMIERTAKGKQAREYFLACERRLRDQAARPPAIPADMDGLMKVVRSYVNERVVEVQADLEAERRRAEAEHARAEALLRERQGMVQEMRAAERARDTALQKLDAVARHAYKAMREASEAIGNETGDLMARSDASKVLTLPKR